MTALKPQDCRSAQGYQPVLLKPWVSILSPQLHHSQHTNGSGLISVLQALIGFTQVTPSSAHIGLKDEQAMAPTRRQV